MAMPRPPWKSEHGVDAVLSRWLASSIVKPCFCSDETLPGTDFPEESVTAESYQPDIAAVLGVSTARAAVIAAEYPLDAYPSPDVGLSTLVSDANFACPALEVDQWTWILSTGV